MGPSEKKEIWYLSISTFAGVVGGASHVIGQLYCSSKRYGGNIEYVMTRAEAADFNRFDGTIPQYYKFRAGDTSTRWADEGKLIAEAGSSRLTLSPVPSYFAVIRLLLTHKSHLQVTAMHWRC